MAPHYPTGRRACLAGYRDMPALDTTMTFDLLQLPRVTSRLVRIGNRLFELWSPNSLQLPFLPGRWEHCYDGHSGKHDPIYAPQYWLVESMHWAMMRRVENVSSDDSRREAFLPFTTQWKEEGLSSRIRATFVDRLSAIRRDLDAEVQALRPMLHPFPGAWNSRPLNPTYDQVERLRSLRTWEDAVDRGVAIQRDLREKEAWVAWWHEHLRQRASGFSLARLQEIEHPLADDQFIGVWVNGAPEETVLCYMAASVPCFIVHKFKGLVTGIRDEEVQVREDFLQGTTLEVLLGDDNPYPRIARGQVVLLDSMPGTDDGQLWAQPSGSAEDEMRSSSSRLLALAQTRNAARDESRTLASAPPATTSVLPSTVSAAPASLLTAPSVGASGPSPKSRTIPRAMSTTIDKYAAPTLVTRIIDPTRTPWIVPPPIAARGTGPRLVNQSARKLTNRERRPD
ncbi:hypothetical protein B0H13DRAFT_1899406 [Mycena leptocephala]|nr:hypothetical protein B0H13DRAFT_1899406 [Mycena leptocephala]